MDDQRKRPAAAETSNVPKKRKIRKGTQSCWECKRRKIRCTFTAPTDIICDGCRSRQTRCISQEFPDELALASRVDRLGRVESLVEELVKRSGVDALNTLRGQSDQANTQPVDSVNNKKQGTNHATESPQHHPAPNSDLQNQLSSDFDDLSRALIAAWPDQQDLDIILSVPVGVSVLLHGVICKSYSDYFSGRFPPPRYILQLPVRESHPVLIARKLLLLATFLQGVPPCSTSQLDGLTSSYQTVMSRAFTTATRLVTSNDELINSLEGLECVMIESMYLNNAGNLRRAWLANRRAMVAAQMMGLHTGTGSLNLFLEISTQDRIDPDYMWFRLVCSDRYLSLMLGLPQGSPENTFASSDALTNSIAVERMERLESIAGGLILQRNSIEKTDLVATYKIDKMLQEASESMPPHWWALNSNLATIVGNDGKAFEESIRLMNQFTHYHLLVQLHLPYMLLPPSINPKYDYSKMTAANASRAIITQFVAFHEFALSPAYCRGIDFIAFIASTTLCLAHIETRRQDQNDISCLQSLRHQRLSDRGLLERLLDIMEKMARENSGVVARQISSILGPLLDIEDNSFRGSCYQMRALENVEKSRCVGQINEASDELRIHIPHCGTIIIEHPSQYVPHASDADRVFDEPAAGRDQGDVDFRQSQPWYIDPIPGLELDVDDWALQGVDTALFSSLMQGRES
ncbi:conserved hypothetical protein [Talaromyces stipitatus ATCC 10500]|uniref:Zn(2)-C6 fungal-type domain-containing protein n=1 Tax=Talaromyces stipitatus (strain ATCC 10500 / CBS 375.48 / QM 6759 / NRRL 1006) TaxID=441959 RepID=B8M654_TALSN|nr:uncharacterized protein TSTA_023870 [Talaromyces stipitatus ATCC 10500]EED19054.1 conserved hypothetical protein [Talaromyces stipitatus ATCC 10500]